MHSGFGVGANTDYDYSSRSPIATYGHYIMHNAGRQLTQPISPGCSSHWFWFSNTDQNGEQPCL